VLVTGAVACGGGSGGPDGGSADPDARVDPPCEHDLTTGPRVAYTRSSVVGPTLPDLIVERLDQPGTFCRINGDAAIYPTYQDALVWAPGGSSLAFVEAEGHRPVGFVVVDLGNPLGSWHLIPGIGFLNWPRSLLAWDVIVLNGYLALNLAIPFYILYSHFAGRTPEKRKDLPWMYIAVMWAVSIHLVTAFLLAGLPARPPQRQAEDGEKLLGIRAELPQRAPLPRRRGHARPAPRLDGQDV
jgi:hypothetical protein